MKLLHSLVLILLLSQFAFSQKSNKSAQPAPAAPVTIESKVAGMKSYPGYFNFYFDEKRDKIFLVIDKFDTEFLYINSLTAGVGSNDIGLDRGQLGGERIVKFDRRGPKVLLVEPNYMYRAITTDLYERRAVEQSFAQSVQWGFSVEAEEKDKVLVDATGFFLRDAQGVSDRLRDAKQGQYSIDESRSAFFSPGIKNFPKNSEFESTLTFVGKAEGEYIQSVAPTPSSVTVRQHHSFVELPDKD
ncbi:MAG TPA: DUF5117 domain-containing protein, partial [Chryseolinea sp.]|nr:DUF5117 domain-containing protein [Chryseolinea sp.]